MAAKEANVEGRRTRYGAAMGLGLRILLSIFFLIAGAAKFVGDARHVAEFAELGLGQWFRFFTGTFELAGAVFILIPHLVAMTALLLACEMVIAVILHFTLLEGSAIPALFALAASAIVFWLYRRQLLGLFGALS